MRSFPVLTNLSSFVKAILSNINKTLNSPFRKYESASALNIYRTKLKTTPRFFIFYFSHLSKVDLQLKMKTWTSKKYWTGARNYTHYCLVYLYEYTFCGTDSHQISKSSQLWLLVNRDWTDFLANITTGHNSTLTLKIKI